MADNIAPVHGEDDVREGPDDDALPNPAGVDEENGDAENVAQNASLDTIASDLLEVSDMSIIDPEIQAAGEETLEMMSPDLISMHRASALAKGRTGGIARPGDWASSAQLTEELRRSAEETYMQWWERMAFLLSEAVSINCNFAPAGRLLPMELARVGSEISKTHAKGGAYAWHIALTTWRPCQMTLGLPESWDHLDMGWPITIKEGYAQLRQQNPVLKVSRNVVEYPVPVGLGNGPSAGTFFNSEFDAAPQMQVLCLELLDTHLEELDALLQKFAGDRQPELRLGIRPQHKAAEGGNPIPLISRFSRTSFLALKGFDVSGLPNALPADSPSFLRTLYVQTAPGVGSPLRLVQIALILRECKNLGVLEIASGDDIGHEPSDDVSQIATTVRRALRSGVTRLCISTISPDKVDLLHDWFDFPIVKETEFVIRFPPQHDQREACYLPESVGCWTKDTKQLVISARQDSTMERNPRVTIDYSLEAGNDRKQRILHILCPHRRSAHEPLPARGGTGEFWPDALIDDIGRFFPKVTDIKICGTVPNQRQSLSLLHQLPQLSHMSIFGPNVKVIAAVLRKNQVLPNLEKVILWQRTPAGKPSQNLKQAEMMLMLEAHKITEAQRATPNSKLDSVVIRHNSATQVVMRDGTTHALNPDAFAAFFPTSATEEEYSASTDRFFDAGHRWSLEELASKLMYTATDT
ncbi:hypothetical protein SISSUDRAFT_1133081 [Sistotremastrum suecicum HHB10207 ss-3]|uniref:Uncharacterized protein n=1 Tax=Sistotremastrum suecicum HHB10207 ss-3 TaxID=1314776 RepID=A0A165XVM9_9AGAM|nr:hypothetical protein SISSUDRAFT_1133081 [Sistotremastrum suecicum HHB10207 ss-3]